METIYLDYYYLETDEDGNIVAIHSGKPEGLTTYKISGEVSKTIRATTKIQDLNPDDYEVVE